MRRVETNGVIQLAFSRIIHFNFDPAWLQSGDETGVRRLEDEGFTEEEKDFLVQHIQVDFYERDAEDLTEVSDIVSVKLNTLTERSIEIELKYSIPAAVSKDPRSKDRVSVKFDERVFDDPFSYFEINDGEPIIVELPRQVDQGQAEAVEAAMESVKTVGGSVAVGTSIGQVLLNSSLKVLWGLISTLQFVVFFPDWQIQMPNNAKIAIQHMRTIALGEFIPSEWLTEPIKSLFKTEGEEESEAGDH